MFEAPFGSLFYVQDVRYAAGAWMRRSGVSQDGKIKEVSAVSGIFQSEIKHK